MIYGDRLRTDVTVRKLQYRVDTVIRVSTQRKRHNFISLPPYYFYTCSCRSSPFPGKALALRTDSNADGISCTSSEEKISFYSSFHLEKLAFHRNVRTFKFLVMRGNIEFMDLSLNVHFGDFQSVIQKVILWWISFLDDRKCTVQLYIPRCSNYAIYGTSSRCQYDVLGNYPNMTLDC